jgi:tetratricopeptide (TPR) repeat protein
VETAFITVPGHIFMAVSLNEAPDQARKDFGSLDNLILLGDKSWLPIETTERGAGFVQSWERGAKEWRENLAKNQAVLYPVHEAWSLYEPVGFAADMGNIVLPDSDRVVAAYLGELVHYIDQEIYPQVAKLQAEVTRSNGSPKAVNQLGVLYAKYGLNDRAEAKFRQALQAGDYAPALLNIGHLSYLLGSFQEALAYYERAQKLSPDNPTVLLALARANHELENYGVVKVTYEKLKAADPNLAERFAYLELKGAEGIRAPTFPGSRTRSSGGRNEARYS